MTWVFAGIQQKPNFGEQVRQTCHSRTHTHSRAILQFHFKVPGNLVTASIKAACCLYWFPQHVQGVQRSWPVYADVLRVV